MSLLFVLVSGSLRKLREVMMLASGKGGTMEHPLVTASPTPEGYERLASALDAFYEEMAPVSETDRRLDLIASRDVTMQDIVDTLDALDTLGRDAVYPTLIEGYE